MKLESVPPETETSSAEKSEEASDRLKERDAASPMLSEARSEPMAMLGRSVSMARLSALSASSPSALLFPAASEKLELATLIRPLLVLLIVGVKLAE